MKREIRFSQDARSELLNGVTTLAKAVKSTLGPRGRNVAIQTGNGSTHHITKDGVTVAKSVTLQDPFQNMGAKMVVEVASKTADFAGDGTTTATVLAEEILKTGLSLVAAGHDPMSLKRGMSKAVNKIVAHLKEQAIEVQENKQIMQVGTISANGDAEVGQLIADAMDKVGTQGLITLDEGKGSETTLETTSGFEFDRGYSTVLSVNDRERQRVVYTAEDNAMVFVTAANLTGADAINGMTPIMQHAMNSGQPLVVIADTIGDDFIKIVHHNIVQSQILKCLVVKAPGFGDRKKEMLEDIAILTGAKLRDMAIDEDFFDDFEPSELGTLDRLESYSKHTVIVPRDGQEDAVLERVEQIETQIKNENDSWNREQLSRRLAMLTGGIASIKVGAPTETEMKEKKDLLEDALAATRAAVEEGVVPGGGTALARASQALDGFTTGNKEEDFGVDLVRKAVTAPLKQIVTNAGEPGEVVLAKVLEAEGNVGFNARTMEMSDLVDDGVLDPVKVTRVALQNAASIAGLMLTTEGVIVFDEEEAKEARRLAAVQKM